MADRLKQEKTSVKHCPTQKTLAELFTKPLQGSKFNLFSRVIMGWYDVSTLWEDSDNKEKVSSISKECVEDTGNNVDVDDRHIDGHVDTHIWYDIVRRGTIEVRNVKL